MEPIETARRWLRTALPWLGGAAVGLALVGAAGCADPAPTPELKGQVHLTLLHTADIHSRLFPYQLQITQIDSGLGLGADNSVVNVGGAARVSYIIGRERARADRVLHLDCGDSFQGAPVFNYFNGEPEIRTLSAMGTDASLVANHEFDKGALNLGLQLERWATFPVLAANYLFDDPTIPGASPLGGKVRPFTVLDVKGLKVGVIGMGNLSSLTAIFDSPNRLGITPLDTTETAQFYVDLLRPQVDVIIVLSHLGLEVDQQMIQTTSGIDIVLGSHNHVVLQPPRQIQDCSFYAVAPFNHGDTRPFVLQDPPNAGEGDVGCMQDADCGAGGYCFGIVQGIAMSQGICKQKRYCHPRNVLLAHSGAFAKYVGRLDLLFSNNPADLSPACTDAYPGNDCATEPASTSSSSSSSGNGTGGGGTGGSGTGGGGTGGAGGASSSSTAASSSSSSSGVPGQSGVAPACNVPCYDPADGFELVTNDYTLFPINDQTADDPVITELLEPYEQKLDATINLQTLLGYSQNGSSRTAASNGDSPLGDVVATAMWLRLGIQTDFSLTNTTGIRTQISRGVVTEDEMFNVFPFDNTITKISLFGQNVQYLFDYVATRSATRGCYSQAQIAGARIVVDCKQLACQHIYCGAGQVCDPVTTLCVPEGLCHDVTCPAGPVPTGCEPASGGCVQGATGIASHVYIGTYDPPIMCNSDTDCPGGTQNQCDKKGHVCWEPLDPNATYQLATSNYLAAGGSGYFALKGNTTSFNTQVLQRDALIDYIRAGLPCGSDATGQLTSCSVDSDCANVGAGYVCACPAAVNEVGGMVCQTAPQGCGGKGECVLQQCRNDVAAYLRTTCAAGPTPTVQQMCASSVSPCASGGEACKYLSCIDDRLGNYADGRIQMVGQ